MHESTNTRENLTSKREHLGYYFFWITAVLKGYTPLKNQQKNQQNTTLIVDVKEWVDHAGNVREIADPLGSRSHSSSAP